MKLGLQFFHKLFANVATGAFELNGQELCVVDLQTTEALEKPYEFVWGRVGGPMIDCGLFTEEHFRRDKNYLVLVIPCDQAIGNERCDVAGAAA